MALKFGDDALSKHLPQFDAPLVDWIDVPRGALGGDPGVLQDAAAPAPPRGPAAGGSPC